jgi:hypothetical protein
MLRRVVLLGVMACCVTALSGCVVLQPKPDGTYSVSFFPPSNATTISGSTSTVTGSMSSGGASSSNGRTAYPGQTLKSGPWSLLVESTEFPRRLQNGSKPASGKRFLLVNVTIRNIGSDAALTVLPNQFTLWGPDNKAVDPYPAKLGIYNAQSVRPINAAMGGYTSFVYEVPVNDTIYTFTITPKQGASGSMSWYVP